MLPNSLFARRGSLLGAAMWLLSLVLLPANGAVAADDYVLGADSQRQPGVPEGTVTKKRWVSEKIFPGTERDFWVYVPQQYKPTEPAALLVLQDGGAYVDPQGQFRTTIVLDNLIHQGAIPVTIAVFINPGQIPATAEGQKPRANRSFEYDTLSDQYARFLLEELLPEVGREFKLTTNPADRVIGGISSGAICAFTVAWERPEAFGKVLSHVGSYTNIRGGHVYPSLIRKTERKPVRIFLQEGSNDLDNLHGSWPLANQEMAAAFKFAGYDYRFEYGDGGHNGKHGGALMPESLRWLWREHRK
ncbi:MAG: alpha/beta hydrolase [Planctomycetaceae bacterium]